MTILLILWLVGQSSEQELFELDEDLPEELLQKEVLLELKEHPLDLNRATGEELVTIPYLNPVLVDRIIRYRKESGFRQVADLAKISGFDSELVRKLSELVTVAVTIEKKRGIKKELETRLRLVDRDFSFPESFKNRSLYSRIDGTLGNSRLVVITEKDSGETDFFDFWASGLGYSAAGRRLAVGNFLISAGQGLVFAAPFGFISGREFSLDIGKGDDLVPQTVSGENTSLFGIGCSQKLGSWMPMVLVSSQTLDATINPDGSVDNVSYDGLHADSAERAEKDRLGERLLGARLACKRKDWAMGITGYTNRYDRDFRPEDSTDSFYGNHLTVAGADYAGIWGNYFTYGEVGYSLGNGLAGIAGLMGDMDRLKVGFSLRGYQHRFFSPHSRVSSLASRHDRLEAYFSSRYRLKSFQFLLYGTTYRDFVTDSMPSRLQLEITKTEKFFNFGLVLKESFKEGSPRSQGMRFDAGYSPWKWLTLSLRLEDRYVLDKTVKRSFLVFGNCECDARGVGLALRWYRFNIGSSSARIYAYEPGLAGLGGNRSFSGNGFRALGIVTLRFGKRLRWGVKSGFTHNDSTTVDFASQLEFSY